MLKQLTGYKAWANRELFDGLLALPTDIASEPRHRMIRLLNHVYVVDQILRAHLSATQHGHRALNTVATPGVDELWAAVQEMDQWYLDYAAELTDEQAQQRLDFVFVDGAVGELLHQCGATPPRDVLTRYF